MSFDKHYPRRKDWRRNYEKRCERYDATCRPHGGCPWCLGNRRHADKKRKLSTDEQIEDPRDGTP